MSDAIKTQGFEFAIGAGSSPIVYTDIGEIVSFQGLDGQAAEIDVTHLQSVAKEFLMGLQDFGSFSIDVNYLTDDPGQQALRAAKATGDKKPFRATLSNGETFTFEGYVLSNPISGGVDAKVDGSFAIRITGDVVFSA